MAHRALLLGAVWWALTGGDRAGAVLGAAVVLAATIASVAASRPLPVRVSPSGSAVLAWTFVVEAARGGWDVAWRALSPRLPLDPRFVRHTTPLAPGLQRRMFACLNTLMPGSLCVDANSEDLLMHVLVDRGDVQQREFDHLDARIARAVRLTASESDR